MKIKLFNYCYYYYNIIIIIMMMMMMIMIIMAFFFCKLSRSIYPGGHGQYSKLSGCGLLRLHSTYRHDLKIYASDEGRVQMTAAAFAKASGEPKRAFF